TVEATLALLSRPRKNDLQSLIEHQVKVFGVFGSPGFKRNEQELRTNIERALRRSRCARGIIRQLAAIMATGDRSRDMAHIKAPTLVIHGDKDPLVPVAAGRDTAAKIPDAKLKIIEGMGHDMAPWPLMAEAILEHLRTVGYAQITMTASAKRPAPRRYGGMSDQERRDERQRRFLEAGLETFGSLGYSATTTRRLCAEAGLTQRYFYQSFEGMEALFVAVAKQLSE